MFSKKFIKATAEFATFENPVSAPYLRKSFDLDFVPEKAEITICGLGFYELYINGKNVTKGPLAPYISNPDDLLYYDHYDLKEYLNQGENVIGIILGNGFMNPFDSYGNWDFDKVPWRGAPCVALYFEAKGEKALSFEADESFKTHPSPIFLDGLRSGYHYDATKEIPNWNISGFDDSSWNNALIADAPKGEAKLCEAEPVKAIRELKPVSITHYDELCFAFERNPDYSAYIKENCPDLPECKVNDVYVYDFGVNSAGICKVKIKGKKGQKIRLKHGEMLVDGKFNMNSIYFQSEINRLFEYAYKQTDEYILKGGEEEIFVPKFTYHGFQYVMVEGLTKEQATNDALTYIVMNSDLKPRASFKCSDDIINKLYEMSVRSDLANFYYFPTDCPHREKNGWTGDASMSAPHMLLNYYCGNSFKEWLNNVRAAQNQDGAFPGIVPTGGWGFEWGNGPIWDSAITNLCYYTYRYEGDIEIIKQNKDAILAYLKYIAGRRDEKGLIHVGLGDWVQPAHKWGEPLLSPLEYTDSSAIFDMCKKCEFMFDLIDFKEGLEFASKLKDELKRDIRKNLIDFDTLTVVGNCITSQCTAIWFELFEEDEIKGAFDRLIEIIEGMETPFLNCGMFGLRYIFRTLSKYGRGDLAYKLIMQENMPSYYRMIKSGLTALGEHLTYYEVSTSSHNHHFLGDISAWFIERIAGLNPNPTAKDINEVEIAPDFLENIDFAEASFEAKGEIITVYWKREDGKITLTTTIPEHIHGKIILPGNYKFENKEKTRDLLAGKNTYIIA